MKTSIVAPARSQRAALRRAGRSAPAVPLAVAGACAALGGLSLLISSSPTLDPWVWIVWGREVAHLNLDTAVGGAPSWKPLPVLFTTPLSVFGGAAPILWLWGARAAGFGALALAFGLARRLAGWPAGLVAAAGLVVLPETMHGFLHGFSEGVLLCLVLGAVELHVRGRVGGAVALGTLAALDRPETWVVLAAYAAWAWRRRGLSPAAMAAAVAVPPALWLGGDLWGAGDALHGGHSAQAVTRAADKSVGSVLSQGFGSGLLAIPLLAAVATVRALRRGESEVVGLAALATAWIALVVVLTALGYPASARFLVSPEALLCVLAGAGAVALVEAARPARLRIAAAVLLVLAACLWPAADRSSDLSAEISGAAPEARLQHDLRLAVRPLHGAALRGIRLGLPNEYHWNRGAIAWELGLHLNRIRGLPGPGAPHALVVAGPRVTPGVARRAGWQVCSVRKRTREASELDPLLAPCAARP